MPELDKPRIAGLDAPRRVDHFPFAETIDISAADAAPNEPCPCLPAATAAWYLFVPPRSGWLTVDLVGSTPHDAVLRLYNYSRVGHDPLEFIACSSPIWNGQLSLEARVNAGQALLAQVGTSESRVGWIVVRAELHAVGERTRSARLSDG